ncbi:DUF4126 family protein [Devosia sp.]|uniref:DUF4126 family protein n=1 Tax=Devosia sp. TaxID=1871048 RepID=UPI003A91FA60
MIIAILMLGLAAGLRTFMPLAAISVAAFFGWIDLSGTWAAFVGHPVTTVIVVLLALGELYGDTRPETPSRLMLPALIGRTIAGALAGLIVSLPAGNPWLGLILGAIAGVAGTYGGHAARLRLAKALKRDLPAALIEDAVAIGLAFGAMALVAGA